MAPSIFTAPEDIPLHPSAPEYVAQGSRSGPGDCVATSSFTLIAEHQRVMAAKARFVSSEEKKRDQDKNKTAKIPKLRHVHHPRSKAARKAWVARNDAERGQDTTSTNALVAEHVRLADIIESTGSRDASKQTERSSSGIDDNVAVDEKVSGEFRDEDLLHPMPPTPSISSTPLSPSSSRVDALDDNIGHASEDEEAPPSITDIAPANILAEKADASANTSSESSVPADTAEKPPIEVARDPKTGGMPMRWRMIRPAPALAKETVLQPVSAPVQSPASAPKNKAEKALPGKENNKASASASATVSAGPLRRSQRTLKRKRGENEGLVGRSVDA